ncbi:hypothetical protein HRR83_006773 [Exophiala dermatitidis]|nr:hypothetical protein HRR74_005934 [Exophiala dermatitidis]KAJ4515242.1 hypothetical protein HRR73_005072 [Exophiala dermatitidis]KAJ4535354.1 hypothetical protein HRR77_007972 [Exophiala dermatitidis]KAJ4540765.1 hypothetical protein HRR76_004150 [Exophiala dermatitidis]KAJ4556973.1 hypothetical protein HRR79_008778 [Exophiala dermatitidis]
MESRSHRQVLFGSNGGWYPEQWTASDDRVRGGSSQSYLDCSGPAACFHGRLDIGTLGGAGFASQRTVRDDWHLKLDSFAGVEVSIDPSHSDNHVYTLILKDHLLPPNRDNGREQSTMSWEFDFSTADSVPAGDDDTTYRSLFIPWGRFRPTYRGKSYRSSKPLDVSDIRRVSIMIRSFFGSQQGEFRLRIHSLTACSAPHLREPSNQ